MKVPVSVVILTQDEERNLTACLESINWCDDIHIIDSGSTDKTLEIANKNEIQCKHHPFESFGKQRNWALDNCNFKYKWILFLDADERSTREFDKALLEALKKTDKSTAGFYCCSKMILNDSWLKRAVSFPNWQFRILRFGYARFMDFGHGQKEYQVKGEIGYIKEPYLHYPFRKGWVEWWARHDRYSQEEAIVRLKSKIDWKGVLSKNSSIRNMALRPFVSRIPAWPLLRFCIDYFLRLGFLDGYPGFIYCRNMAFYEFFIQVKMCKLLREKLLGM